MTHQASITVRTRGRGTYEITREVAAEIARSNVKTGLCHVFIHHTSASLILCENADPSVRADLERFMARLAPDGDPGYRHDAEGPDDMPAHIRTVLTQTGFSLPIIHGRPGLGAWQGVYVWEHRAMPHARQVTITVQGEAPGA